ncbi:prolyl oligopeptidase family serine peptidase [Aquimarina longa]|uniref:prolyl oligopeptidase family serine peptidase n=1 Tax=Aquimarina longa TaxID=1080221 RepID=UPI00078313EA|nr:prolyl oligopeptidase family serine peptidase [Aquimarina longa]
MKYTPILFILLSFCIGCKKNKNVLISKIKVDTIHGQNIEDPYRNAENLEDSEVKKWVDQQNSLARAYLKKIGRTNYLIEKQKKFDAKKTFTISQLSVTTNDLYFYLKRQSSENVAKLYYRNSFEGKEEMLYDPKKFKQESNTEYVINYIQPNWDGTKIVISLTEKGKEISELIIVDVDSKKVHSELLTNSWASEIGGITWLPDNSSFIYVHHPITDPKDSGFLKNTKSVIYILGNNKDNFKEFFSKKHNSDLGIMEEDFPVVSLGNKNDKYLIGEKSGVAVYNDAYYLPIDQITSKKWKLLFKKSDQIKDYIIKNDSIFYRTSKNAPNYEIRKTSISNPSFNTAEVLVKEKKDTIITDFNITKEGLFFVTSKNGVKANLFKLNHKTHTEIKFPYVFGNISLSTKSVADNELYIETKGWLTQNKRYEYQKNKLIEKNMNRSYEENLLKDIVIEELEVTAHDGQKIPLSLLYKKPLVKNSNNITMMEGYGAYGASMNPSFSLRRLLWVMEGGIYAIAHVRGGGEKGDAWHKGGFKTTKPNTWKDFISCAKFLIDYKFTSKNKLAIWSGSAGGIMIGRAITERPDLFKSSIIEFGTLNPLRAEFSPNGANNTKEFGSIKDAIEFEALKQMDAYHHIKNGVKYPATLLTAGLNDPRVPAWFSVKFAAKMQAHNISNNPNLLLVDSETGHGEDNTKLKEFERYANILSFALWQTGHPEYQLKK